MANEDQIQAAQEALINAHNAGDEEAAQRLADHIVSLQSQQAAPETEDRTIGNVAGAATGAIGGGALGRSLQSGIREEYPEMFKRTITPPPEISAPQPTAPKFAGAPEVPKTGGENWVKSLTGANIPDAQMSKKDLDLAKGMRETVGRGGPMAGGSITESGIMLGPKDTAAMAKEAAAAKQAAAPSLIGRAKDVAKTANKNVGQMMHGMTNPWAVKTLGNVLSGAATGMQAADAYQRFKDPNQGWIRSAISGLGALGSGATMTRIPAAMPIGMAVGTAAPFVNEYLDEWAKEHPEAAKRLHLADGGRVPRSKKDLLMEGLKAAKSVFTPKESTVTRMSDALSNDIGKWVRPTQADRMRAEQGDLGGIGFSKFQHEKPEYAAAKSAWGVMNPTAATRIANINAEKGAGNTIWTPMIGSPTQHHSNQHVHDTLVQEFNRNASLGKLTPELRDALNTRAMMYKNRKTGNPVFSEGIDFGDPEQLASIGSTFEKRAIMGELMGGKGVGGRKGTIIPYEDIMMEYMDPATRGVETHSLGNRLFTLTGEHSHRPDLHSAFPQNLAGEDRAVIIKDLPSFETGMPDWTRQFREAHAGRTPGFFDKTLGSKQVGYPAQEITEPYLESLYKAGYAEGGEVKHMAGGKLTGGLATLPKGQQTELQKLEHGYNRFANQPAYQKAEMIGESLSSVPELAASFHPGYGLGYAGGALYDAVTNTGDYGNAAMETAINAPGILKPIGAGIKAAAPAIRAALPVAGGLGALGAADAAEAGQGSKLKQIIGGVMDQYAPKAEKAIVPGAPHTYGPQATGPWMRDYQPAQRSAAALDDRAYWDQLAAQHRAAQNKVDYSMGRTGPTQPQPIQYMGKYRQGTPEERAAVRTSQDDAIRSAIENRKAQWVKRSKEMGMTDQEIMEQLSNPFDRPWMP